ncbi:MAG: radical SAM protein [Candidatus Micrarchaeota archaeon]
MRTIRSADEFIARFPRSPALEEKVRRKNIRVTDFYIENILRRNPDHPLIETIVGTSAEGQKHVSRPEAKVVKSPFLVQKYSSNAIIITTTACPQKCSYCFRKSGKDTTIPQEELERIFSNIARADSLVEVILSGGDPLFVSPRLLGFIAEKTANANRNRNLPIMLTIHTRLPVVAPLLFTEDVLSALRKLAPANMDFHIIHPDEITEEFVSICRTLCRDFPGISLRTIHPLLAGINDRVETLKALYLHLFAEARVVPRDLILSMPGHTPPSLMVALEDGMRIMRELSAAIPGHYLPRLVVCSPAYGKSYVDPFHQKKDGSFGYDVDADGFFEGMFIKDGSGLQHSSSCLRH